MLFYLALSLFVRCADLGDFSILACRPTMQDEKSRGGAVCASVDESWSPPAYGRPPRKGGRSPRVWEFHDETVEKIEKISLWLLFCLPVETPQNRSSRPAKMVWPISLLCGRPHTARPKSRAGTGAQTTFPTLFLRGSTVRVHRSFLKSAIQGSLENEHLGTGVWPQETFGVKKTPPPHRRTMLPLSTTVFS